MKKPDFEALAAKLKDGGAAEAFALPSNRFLKRNVQRERRKHGKGEAGTPGLNRRLARRLTKPENSREVADRMPKPGESLHAIIRGDFIICDLIGEIAERYQITEPAFIATLSLSLDNALSLAKWVDSGLLPSVFLVTSTYFTAIEKAKAFPKIRKALEGRGEIAIARTHAKVFALAGNGNFWAIEGSANLRSSGNLENIAIVNDPEAFEFHRGWMEELREPKKTPLEP